MPWEPGETGNTKGQIRAKPIRDALYAILSRDDDDPLMDKPKTKAQRVALGLFNDSQSPNEKIRIPARAELIDRTDGKAVQAIEATGKDGTPLNPPAVHIYLPSNGRD